MIAKKSQVTPMPLSRRGVTVVEFSLTFPILLIFVIGMIEFVRMHTLTHAADNAAYEAARHVIVPGASQAEATARADELLARTGVTNATYNVTPSVILEDTPEVTVQVSIPLASNSWIPSKFIADHTITRQTTLMTERGQRPDDISVGENTTFESFFDGSSFGSGTLSPSITSSLGSGF